MRNLNDIRKPYKGFHTNNLLMLSFLMGTLDILAAVLLTLYYGGDPIKMLGYIASGALGTKALSGALYYVVIGLFFHYGIAFVWTVIFMWGYKKVPFLSQHRILTGMAYGLIIWSVMDLIIIPLSLITPGPFNIARAITGALILILAIGLPLSFITKNKFPKG
ncbi:hypothetical protein [Galbibacter pacificus]|uniref:DUF1440 domain-containing protein n=1 Tax=Galbibacter pacificus TaxID=2996052 RepID=A0ABT6FMZ3_9FLAO|nr:hypothetical protein [Galbibacter pacificus]MDG3581159.1 hypothetical protein [Galbibacter pacificus]MDG3584637.1 hypothetical protein [Galbibacter pacificus]